MGFIALPEEQAEPIKATFNLRAGFTAQESFVKRTLNPIEQLSREYHASSRAVPVRSTQGGFGKGDGQVQLGENGTGLDVWRTRGRGHAGFLNVRRPVSITSLPYNHERKSSRTMSPSSIGPIQMRHVILFE
jgi:hypothetical protein